MSSKFQARRQYFGQTSSRNSHKSTPRKLSFNRKDTSTDNKSRFQERVAKACTTYSTQHLMKEIALYKGQIERMNKESLRKDKHIMEIKSSLMQSRQLEVELKEAYRVICFYEGKMQTYEKELKRCEIAIGSTSADAADKIQQLLQSYRKENAELKGNIQQMNQEIFQLQNKIKEIQAKYFQMSWKLASKGREIANPLKKRFPNLRNTITIKDISLEQKEKMYKTAYERVKSQQRFNVRHQPNANNRQEPHSQEYNLELARIPQVKSTVEPINIKSKGQVMSLNQQINGEIDNYMARNIITSNYDLEDSNAKIRNTVYGIKTEKELQGNETRRNFKKILSYQKIDSNDEEQPTRTQNKHSDRNIDHYY